MKRILSLLLTVLISQTVVGGSLVQGPPLTDTDLAMRLNVCARTLTYRQDSQFKSLSYSLTYKERMPNGTYSEKAAILSGEIPYSSPKTEVSLVVFLDKDSTTISSETYGLHSKGFDIGKSHATETPPQLRKGGGFILLKTLIDPLKGDTEQNTKFILELELNAKE